MSVTKVTDAMRNVTAVDGTKISGAVPLAALGNAPATDLTPVHQAIATLGLHTAVSDNKAAFNLPNAFIDTFEDDTGITTETTVDRNASEYVSTVVGGTTNATGTLVSDVQTAPEAKTEVSGVILYTDAEGTNTLGTDLKIYFTADNGSNWTEASSYGTAQTFSGTTKQVKLGKTTVTSGTAVALKGVWANQVAGASKTVTATGNTQHSTAAQKIGTTSIKFDGDGDRLVVSDHDDFDFGTGAFTIECWFNVSVINGTTQSARNQIIGKWGYNGDWCLSISSSGNKVQFWIYDVVAVEWTTTPTTGTWYHCAVVREGTGTNETKMYIDGVEVDTGTVATNFPQAGASHDIYIGQQGTPSWQATDRDYEGYLDQIRISNNARWTSAFGGSLPTTAYTYDANTKLLIQSNTTNASTEFTDIGADGKVAQLNGWAVNY